MVNPLIGKTIELETHSDCYSSSFSKVESVELVSEIGRGRNAIVYSVKDRNNNDYALKILKDVTIDEEDHLYKRFKQACIKEFKVSQKINHPNIVKNHQYGDCVLGFVYSPYILSEFVDGKTLLDSKNLATEELLRIYTKVVETLDVIHKSEIVHRDIKPDNIMLAKGNLPKILDFGLSYFNMATTILTRLSSASWERGPGYVYFLAPELWSKARDKFGIELEPDENFKGLFKPIKNSDMFALGVLFYYLLTDRKMPYAEEEHEILYAILDTNFEVIHPKEYNPDIPDLWNKAIIRCLERGLSERFEDAGELLKFIKTN